ncbi:MAG: extracellular solute-binding protein [Hyphomicrobiales bacterium]
MLAGLAIAEGRAEEPAFQHATALIGAPKYPADFKHFDYVNPDAPKGGIARFSDTGTFDSLNFVIPKGTTPLGIGLIYDTLMTSSLDEASTMYGLLAESVRHPDDYSSATFRLRPDARWQDGQPVTAEDVVWSFEVLTANNPQQAFYYQHVTKAEITGEGEVTFTFDQPGNRELPHIVGQLIVLPKHWWTGVDGKGKPRDITAGTLEAPLGSGAYRVKSVVAGRTISYERVADYWGASLPVNVGSNNLDEIRYEYFRDDTVELEAFKADQYDWREENTAKNWATAYDIPAVRDGRVVLEKFPERGRGLMVGFIPNGRLAKFADPQVRRALDFALDFEEMNRTIFFDQYSRIDSYFFGTELAASGLPEGKELEILEPLRDRVPAEVFTTAFTNPVTPDQNAARGNLREAVKLLTAAGYEIQKGKMVEKATGKPFTIEFLLNGPTFERVGLRYKESLARIGIDLSLRTVDSSQYVNRVRNNDFEMIYTGWAQSLSPGNEQRDFFGAAAADRDGSRNYAGIKNPAIDALIDRVIYASDRDDLIAATRALDRVLLWNHYVVPGWTLPATRVARWDRFSHPETLPLYSHGFPTIWWWDEAKAAKAGRPK